MKMMFKLSLVALSLAFIQVIWLNYLFIEYCFPTYFHFLHLLIFIELDSFAVQHRKSTTVRPRQIKLRWVVPILKFWLFVTFLRLCQASESR